MTPSKRTSPSGMAYLASGSPQSKRAVVFVHGRSCRASEYTHFMEKLSQKHKDCQLIAVYLPGHGEGVSTETSYNLCLPPTMPGYANLVLELASDLGMQEIILSGHSMGTRVNFEAWSIAEQQYPGLIKGLILLDGSHARLRAGDRFGMTTGRKCPTSTEEVFMEMFSEQTPGNFVQEAQLHLRTRDPKYHTALGKSYFVWDLESLDDVTSRCGKSGLPVLQIQSTDVDDANIRVSLAQGDDTPYMQWIRQSIPSVKQVLVERAGHFPHIDQKDLTLKHIDDFVCQIFGDGKA